MSKSSSGNDVSANNPSETRVCYRRCQGRLLKKLEKVGLYRLVTLSRVECLKKLDDKTGFNGVST